MKYLMGRKMSKNAKIETIEDQDGMYRCITGSANDILKAIRCAEECGYYPYYLDGPILRNGRKYTLTLCMDTRYWYVSRAV